MQIEVPDLDTELVLRDERLKNDDAFFEFCSRNSDLRIERTAQGEIVIMPPAGFETGYRNNEIARQLANWARADGRGVAVDSNAEFLLQDGSAMAPDASWVSKRKLQQFTKEEKGRFLRLCPEFVVELTSPSDRLSKVQAKMRQWIANGIELGWLIDARHRTVYIYRPGRSPEELVGVDVVAGDGPVEGFRLELADIWRGL